MVKRRERLSPDEYFMRIAQAVRLRANCLGSLVGAVLVQNGRIISTGYNGTPDGMENCEDGGCHRCSHREDYVSGTSYDVCICVHAEQNALLSAARVGVAVAGAEIYTTMRPCFGCTKELVQARVQILHFLHDWRHPNEEFQSEYRRLQAKINLARVDVDDPELEAVEAPLSDSTANDHEPIGTPEDS